jgi:hypothetical protein
MKLILPPINLIFHLGVPCTVFVLTCTMVVLTSFVMCGCFGNMYTCIYSVLYCVFVLFRLCIFILVCFVCTSVRTTATE